MLIATVATVAAGCSGEDAAEDFIENRIEAENGDDVDIDFDDGEIRIQTDDGEFVMETDEDGNISIQGGNDDGEFSLNSDDGVTVISSDDGTATFESGNGDLPDGFPSSVPIPDGLTSQFSQTANDGNATSWVVSGELSGDIGDIGDDYRAALEAAGFESVQVTEAEDSLFFNYAGEEYNVRGTIGGGDGRIFFAVTVVEATG